MKAGQYVKLEILNEDFRARDRIKTIASDMRVLFSAIENSAELIGSGFGTDVEAKRLEQLFARLDKERLELIRQLEIRATFQSRSEDLERERAAQSAVRPLDEVRPEASGCEQ